MENALIETTPISADQGPFSETNLLEVILRRRWITIGVWLITIIVTVSVVATVRPVYEASALLIIEKERGSGYIYENAGSITESKNSDYYYTQYQLLKARTLVERVHKELGLEKHPEFGGPGGVLALQRSININPVIRSRLVYINTLSADPVMAAKISNALATDFIQENLDNQLFISKEILKTLQADPSLASTERLYDALPSVVNNTLVQGLRSNLADLEAVLATLSGQVTEKHPQMIATQSNIATIRRQIKAETQKIIASLKTELSGQLRGNNVRVVDPALVPEWPVKPQKKVIYGSCAVAGLIFGILVAFMVDMLDQSLRSELDVRNKLDQVSFLGLIPFSPHKNSLVYSALTDAKTSLSSESFRNLRTMVDFAGVGDKSDVFLVTSTVQEEGKTYVSSNLGVSFAQMGEKVLLIDGDLRRPKIHKNFRLSQKYGLSDFLATGTDVAELGPLVQKTEIKGLSALVCGTRPPNPAELMNTPRVSAVVSWAKEHFDRVIIDCTPMFPISDTMLWARHVSSVVFVARYGKTRVPLIRNAQQKARSSGLKLLGLIINAAKTSSLTYTQYQHGYYYQDYCDSHASESKTKAKA